LSFVTLAGLASQAGGCLGGSNAATTSDGGGAGGGSSSSGGGGSSSGSGSAEAGDPCTPDPSTIIDDMSGAHGTANATGGYWYTYSDRTVPDSEPPILLSGPDGGAPPGSITPPEGQSFPVSDAGTINGCMWNYREVVGGGENTWGAGFGMDFLSTPPDGGPVPFNTCADLLSLTDAGQIFNVTDIDSGTVGIVQPYDASQWSGISFWGISFTGKPQAVNIQMDDDRTSPWGGVCNPCNYEAPTTPGMTNSCSDNFIKGETFTGTWTQFKIAWSDPLFKTANWSKDGTKQPIDSNKVYNLHFQVTAHPAPAFDLGVAMVQFYK
jgi:hypothetical protein